MRALLVSTYELGRQSFALASLAAWLRGVGIVVDCVDVDVESLDDDLVRSADIVAVHLPMYTATRIAAALLPRVRQLNPHARLAAWGLYAPVFEETLRRAGAQLVVAGECEALIANWATTGKLPADTAAPLGRLTFPVPDRAGLPPLNAYARLCIPEGGERVVGATEASRGCKHVCRHCPVVPIYRGAFRVVPVSVVLEDIEQQVAAGAQHMTFGDPDFLNGPKHALEIVRQLHARFPELSYDVTIKVEHLLAHERLLGELRDTGCVLVTSAVESVSDPVLRILDKGHTRDDFVRVVDLCRHVGLNLQPTFVAFTPWTDARGYADLLRTVVGLDLVGQVTPIQLAIRLLVPASSWLLDGATATAFGEYDEAILGHPWRHPDPRMDALQRHLETLIDEGSRRGDGRGEIFAAVYTASREILSDAQLEDLPPLPARATIPYLTEPWYC